jgi:hypothetical protein
MRCIHGKRLMDISCGMRSDAVVPKGRLPGLRLAADFGIYFAPPQSSRIAAHLKKVKVELRTGFHL